MIIVQINNKKFTCKSMKKGLRFVRTCLKLKYDYHQEPYYSSIVMSKNKKIADRKMIVYFKANAFINDLKLTIYVYNAKDALFLNKTDRLTW